MLSVTAVCCLELSLQNTPLVAHLVLPILHDLNFALRQLSEVGLLAVLTDAFAFVDKPCKRQYLCSRRSKQMAIELDSHIRVLPPFSHPSGPQFAHFLVFLGLMFSFIFFATCCWERAPHVVCKLCTIVRGTATVSSPAAIKGVKGNGVERYLGFADKLGQWELLQRPRRPGK